MTNESNYNLKKLPMPATSRELENGRDEITLPANNSGRVIVEGDNVTVRFEADERLKEKR